MPFDLVCIRGAAIGTADLNFAFTVRHAWSLVALLLLSSLLLVPFSSCSSSSSSSSKLLGGGGMMAFPIPINGGGYFAKLEPFFSHATAISLPREFFLELPTIVAVVGSVAVVVKVGQVGTMGLEFVLFLRSNEVGLMDVMIELIDDEDGDVGLLLMVGLVRKTPFCSGWWLGLGPIILLAFLLAMVLAIVIASNLLSSAGSDSEE